ARTVAKAKNADTPFEEALAIQDYLRSNVYRYSLNVPALSAGGNQLRRFLTQVREGYCEQFAIAMAMMARELGIPSRVGVGSPAGEIVANTYQQVTPHDAHAWPELWFPGAGWTPFEPTPRADGTVDLPVYTTTAGRVPGGNGGPRAPQQQENTPPPPPPPLRAPEPDPSAESDPLAGGGSSPG